jgi:hypothetical protein
VQALFQDAESGLARALALRPEATEWWIERARAAYFLGRYADEAEHGRRAFELAARLLPGELPDERSLTRGPAADVLENEPAIGRCAGSATATPAGGALGQGSRGGVRGHARGLARPRPRRRSPFGNARD